MTDWAGMTVGEHAAYCVSLWPSEGKTGSPEFEEAWMTLLARLRVLILLQIRDGSHHLSKEDVEDIQQEVWMKLYQQLPGLRNKDSFKGLLRAIVHSARTDWMRHRKAEWEHTTLVEDLHLLGGRTLARDGTSMEVALYAVKKGFRQLDTVTHQRILQMLLNDVRVADVVKQLQVTEYEVKKVRNQAKEIVSAAAEELKA